jgi:hypothetical protein
MLDLQHPDRFVTQACDRLHETMPFGWLAAKFVPDPAAAGSMASTLLSRGTLPGPVAEFRRRGPASCRLPQPRDAGIPRAGQPAPLRQP